MTQWTDPGRVYSSDHREPGIIGLLGLIPAQDDPQRSPRSPHISQIVQSVAATPRRRKSPTLPPLTSSDEEPNDVPDFIDESDAELAAHVRQTEHDNEERRVLQGASETLANKNTRPYWSVIADGVHVHPLALNFAYSSHPDGCVLVTDGESYDLERRRAPLVK